MGFIFSGLVYLVCSVCFLCLYCVCFLNLGRCIDLVEELVCVFDLRLLSLISAYNSKICFFFFCHGISHNLYVLFLCSIKFFTFLICIRSFTLSSSPDSLFSCLVHSTCKASFELSTPSSFHVESSSRFLSPY